MPYSPEFFDDIAPGSASSARTVVPRLLEIVGSTSVADVGCGSGSWLSAFIDHGVSDFLGLDGPWVEEAQLRIPRQNFVSVDLSRVVNVGRRFGLAISLEVAEHLPPEAADEFVDTLVRLAPVVVFSAAIPSQGGHDHLNEQWPSYWCDLFSGRGYEVVDCLRDEFWTDERVEWWYAQNMLLFATPSRVDAITFLKNHPRRGVPPLPLVHPELFWNTVLQSEGAQRACAVIEAMTPAGCTLILVDDEASEIRLAGDRRIVPFLERAGEYWGAPESDEQAIGELERLRRAGAVFIAFAWTSFWWLEHYSALKEHLRSNYRCLVEDERIALFDLR